jgi:cephalosporin hydroxylase
MASDEALPPTTHVDLAEPMRGYWVRRLRHSLRDTYMGIPMQKLPEDLRVYEHLLWISRANVVIELGARKGGSTLWFRHRLDALAACGRIERPRVIAVDQRTEPAAHALGAADPSWRDSITLVTGDVGDEGVVEEVRSLVPPGSRCLVSEDTAHLYETTIAALRGFSEFVPVGGFFVVEDGHVDSDELRPQPPENFPQGVVPALHDWLESEGAGFRHRRDLELYGITSNFEGYLERIA